MKEAKEETTEVHNVPSEVRRIASSFFNSPAALPDHFSNLEILLYTKELIPESRVSFYRSDCLQKTG